LSYFGCPVNCWLIPWLIIASTINQDKGDEMTSENRLFLKPRY
jgi:hypothetical protein